MDLLSRLPQAGVPGAVVVDVARARKDGYTRNGRVLTAAGARMGSGRAVAGADGLLAIGDTAATVERAVEAGAGNLSGTVKDLAAGLGGPAVSVVAPGRPCPTAIAVADELMDRKGRLVIVAGGVAPDRLRADESDLSVLKGLTFGEPAVDGDRMTVPFTYSDERFAQSPLGVLFGEVPLDEIYSCG
jgi:hypothetical protein